MNTPTHVILNLALLGRRDRPTLTRPVVLGAILPDVPIYILFAVATFVWGQPQRQIWSDTYFRPVWQHAVDLLHSFPLIVSALAVALLRRHPRTSAFLASMFLHSLGDFPVHVEDAHRHFYPLSDYRFISPVSYWDPRHYGTIAMPAELLTVLLLSVIVWKIVRSRVGRTLLAGITGVYALVLVAFVVRLASGARTGGGLQERITTSAARVPVERAVPRVASP